jgi:hypothetical protein
MVRKSINYIYIYINAHLTLTWTFCSLTTFWSWVDGSVLLSQKIFTSPAFFQADHKLEQCEINPSIIPWNTGWVTGISLFDYENNPLYMKGSIIPELIINLAILPKWTPRDWFHEIQSMFCPGRGPRASGYACYSSNSNLWIQRLIVDEIDNSHNNI